MAKWVLLAVTCCFAAHVHASIIKVHYEVEPTEWSLPQPVSHLGNISGVLYIHRDLLMEDPIPEPGLLSYRDPTGATDFVTGFGTGNPVISEDRVYVNDRFTETNELVEDFVVDDRGWIDDEHHWFISLVLTAPGDSLIPGNNGPDQWPGLDMAAVPGATGYAGLSMRAGGTGYGVFGTLVGVRVNVPEPGTLALLGTGVFGLALRRRTWPR